jgi:hypothetical protein
VGQFLHVKHIDHCRLGTKRPKSCGLFGRARRTHHIVTCRTQKRYQSPANRTAGSGKEYSHSTFLRWQTSGMNFSIQVD